MGKITLIICVLILSIQFAIGQLSDSEFTEAAKTADLIILNESLKVKFSGEKAAFINIIVEKEIDYKIINEDGIKLVNPFCLPQPFDEIYLPHASGIKNVNRLFDEIEITNFDAYIVKQNDSTYKLNPQKGNIEERVVNDRNRFGTIYKYTYTFDNIEIGDILKIKYHYHLPFINNWYRLFSIRIFMHSIHPRKSFDLKWSHHKNLEVDTNFMNNATPSIELEDNYMTYFWHFENLSGCLDEPGSHPHTELPWFSFSPKPYELLYEHYNSFQEDFIPLWYFLTLFREGKLRSAVVDNTIGAKDKDNLRFQRVADKYINMAREDTIGINRLRFFQRWVADSVKYDDAFSFYNNDEDYKRDHSGVELYGGIVREQNKEFIYASMIPKLGNDFFTAYVADKRYGSISPKYYAPMYDNDFLFAAILNNNMLAYILPKSDRNSLYCEELPFYYENIPVFLLYTYDYAGYKRNFNDIARILTTPSSSVKDNYRKTNSLVKVDLNKNIVYFSTKISLSGQFSTLIRFIYQDRPCDSTINPLYLKKVWDIKGIKTITNVEPGETDIFYPFRTSVNADYNAKDIIETGEAEYKLIIKDWIKHIIYPDFDSTHRYTDFYPDFMGTDTYAYMINFDKPIEIKSKPENINLDNNYGSFSFSVSQPKENQVLIMSYYLIKTIKVEKDNIEEVAEIFKAIETLNNAQIIFSVANSGD